MACAILRVSINERINKMSINVEQIKSEYPLGTTDGLTYTVKPRA